MVSFMSKEKIHYNLYNCCSLNKFDKAQRILIEHCEDIDVMYEDGAFFDFAVSKDNLDMLKLLLQYADDKKVDKNQLREILQKNSEGWDISLEMKQILAPYIDFEGSDHDTLNDSLLDDYKVAFDEILEKNNSNENFLTEDNLKKLNEVMENKLKTSENLISFHSAPELHQLDPYEDPSNKDVHVSLSGNHLIDTH